MRVHRRAKIRRPSTLAPGLRFFFVHGYTAADGEDPEVPHGFGAGVFAAFELWGSWLRWSAAPESWPHCAHVVDDLRELWERHHAEIEAASDGEEPWIVTALREADAILRDEPHTQREPGGNEP